MERIRVEVIEDDSLLRETMVTLLGLQPDFDVVGQAGDGELGVKVALAQRPDVVLADIAMPVMDGIEATRRIRETLPETAVVMLTNCDAEEMLFEALKAGAIGYVLKSAGLPEVTEAVRAARRKEGILPPHFVARVMQEFARQATLLEKHKQVFADLTRREVEILEQLGRGARNKDIAERLFISERTVKNHVSAILAKLQVNSRTEAALLANKYGLT